MRSGGLSPLARGTQTDPQRCRWKSRFIPAGAGNTKNGSTAASYYAVYPRWRGEHRSYPHPFFKSGGLSPLARGTLAQAFAYREIHRFIPAGAGNTFLTVLLDTPSAVYPRWRGEHERRRAAPERPCGLSPLARGTHATEGVGNSESRFIPAGAGNTAFYRVRVEWWAVYPRWRGEHGRVFTWSQSTRGLSPLARGTRLRR